MKSRWLQYPGYENHSTIVHRLSKAKGYNKSKLSKSVRAMAIMISQAIRKGEKIRIKGFGTFSPTRKAKVIRKRKELLKVLKNRRRDLQRRKKRVDKNLNPKRELNLYY